MHLCIYRKADRRWKQARESTLLFLFLSSQAGEIEHSEIFSRPRENQLARRFFVKFNLQLLFLIS